MPARPTLLITRPQPQADAWVSQLHSLGQSALALPLLVIEPAQDFAAEVDQAWATLAEPRAVMFVSPNAVLQFFARRPAGSPWPESTWAAATGPGTVAALRAQGVDAACIVAPAAESPQFDASALWHQVLVSRDWSNASVLVVRGETGRDWLVDTWRAHGAQVRVLCAYRSVAPGWAGELPARLQAVQARPAAHAWLFSSSQAITHLQAFKPRADDAGRGWLAAPALATHPRIAESALAAGWARVTTVSPDAQAIVDALSPLGAGC